jgi:hypothetical protein
LNLEKFKERSPEQRGHRESPSVKLLDWTTHPFDLVVQLFEHDKHGADLRPFRESTDAEFEFVLQLLKEDWCGLLEMPIFVWQLVLPRSLHAQIRSHRHWSFFSESHQLSLPINFADVEDYFHIPVDVGDIEKAAMQNAQAAYTALLNKGVLPSLARGVLPMHINLGLSAGCNLRSLFGLVVMRNCSILQGTYWKPLLASMCTELCQKVDLRFERIFRLKPCDINNRCQSTIEQELRVNGKDPHSPCSIYLERFKKNAMA